MKKLDWKDERQILLDLKYDMEQYEYGDFVGNGSSRIVFTEGAIDPAFHDYLCEKYDIDTNFVIKLAAGEGGHYQQGNEINMYKQLSEEGGAEMLAEIFAYGDYICLSEEANGGEIDIDLYEEAFNHFYDKSVMFNYIYGETEWDYDEDEDEDNLVGSDYSSSEYAKTFDMVMLVKDTLDALVGETSDNWQIAKTAKGKYVCYDYGFVPGEGGWSCRAVTNSNWKVWAYMCQVYADNPYDEETFEDVMQTIEEFIYADDEDDNGLVTVYERYINANCEDNAQAGASMISSLLAKESAAKSYCWKVHGASSGVHHHWRIEIPSIALGDFP